MGGVKSYGEGANFPPPEEDPKGIGTRRRVTKETDGGR